MKRKRVRQDASKAQSRTASVTHGAYTALYYSARAYLKAVNQALDQLTPGNGADSASGGLVAGEGEGQTKPKVR
jgi:hypothetical protein